VTATAKPAPAKVNPLGVLLRALKACSEAREWAKPYASVQAAWDACHEPEWMVWYLDRVGGYDKQLRKLSFEFSDRAVRVHAVAALRSAGEALKKAGLDPQSTSVFGEAAKLEALPTIDSLAAAWAARDAAWAARAAAGAASAAAWAASAAAWAASAAAWAASDAAWAASAAAWAASDAAWAARAAAGAASAAAWAASAAAWAARAAAWAASDAAWAAERRGECDRIRALVPEPNVPGLEQARKIGGAE
jgi:hypothetical protein